MSISAKDVNQLRKMTGAGMMDCKKALEEANGNFEEAVTILRKKGQKISAKRADRETTEGVVNVFTNEAATEAILIALNCETDFVPKNEEFVKLADTVLDAAVKNQPADTEALLAQDVEGRPLIDYITDFMGKIGEKIEITAYETMKAEHVATYLHSNKKLGVLLGMNGIESNDVSTLGKDITMQIAAMKPVALDENDVPQEIKDRELEIGKEQALQEGKPANILEKIAEGKLKKFYKDNTLLHQDFVKDNSKSIAQLLKDVSANLNIKGFKRIEIG
jgi:elongation factor Ts